MKNYKREQALLIGLGQFFVIILICGLMAGCASTMEKLKRVGSEPEFSEIRNPKLNPNYKPVSMPMPDRTADVSNPNSLWSAKRKSFYKSSRPSQVGDIMTVVVNIEDEAEMENETEANRNATEDFDMTGLLGAENRLTEVLDEGVTPDDLINLNSQRQISGDGEIEREEEIRIRIAAIVIEVLPNENLVIYGRQEVRVNHEMRELEVSGVIRPQDINTRNEINYDKIAEARIAYGGRGTISDVQAPRYGNEILDILMPF